MQVYCYICQCHYCYNCHDCYLTGHPQREQVRQLYYRSPFTRVPIGVCELVPRGNSSSTSLVPNLSRLPPVNHLSPGQPGPFFWTSSLNTTKAVESLLIPTPPEQLQQPTSLSRYSSLYSCLQLHYTLLATYLILGFQPLTLLPFLSLIIKKHC